MTQPDTTETETERVTKEGMSIRKTPFEEMSDRHKRGSLEELARDSHPKLLLKTVEIEKIWMEDGIERMRISGEKDPIWKKE